MFVTIVEQISVLSDCTLPYRSAWVGPICDLVNTHHLGEGFIYFASSKVWSSISPYFFSSTPLSGRKWIFWRSESPSTKKVRINLLQIDSKNRPKSQNWENPHPSVQTFAETNSMNPSLMLSLTSSSCTGYCHCVGISWLSF